MNRDLKELMVYYRIPSEGELFCSNLKYSLCDENHSEMIGEPGTNNEDAEKMLNEKLKDLQVKYRTIFEKIISQKKIENIDFKEHHFA